MNIKRLQATRAGGGRAMMELKRRGQLAKAEMMSRVKKTWTPDPALIAEAQETQRRLYGASKLKAREAAWLVEASVSAREAGDAATRLQAAHRGKSGRAQAEAERARRSRVLAASGPSLEGPMILSPKMGYQPPSPGSPDPAPARQGSHPRQR